jgi:hypothetical protein
MDQATRDPRMLDVNQLPDAERDFVRFRALSLAQDLGDRGYHSSYLLLIAQAIVDVVEERSD